MEHDCSVLRSIGYYLESLLCLAPFMKHPLRIVLRGVTNDQVDPSVSSQVKPWCDFCFVSCYNPTFENKFLIKSQIYCWMYLFVIDLEM